ncbi:long-chain acyl-CoA synthetase protein [Salinisphaera shabanensis E1L3A]|uniref:Long-chain acyl-CoA synthetase protein n=1 Tax=Salinisphaera shabanensis E1L3A TaxID=1033802 RepID=U2ELN4_9GAMM|nr:long-chain acyl-CoA synthetase protein [Salinisphaera shabanensis]ERJ19092.1 long-chain acyl-CoA synthetase protein [Salinisphaera shabanensis E1L3A]
MSYSASAYASGLELEVGRPGADLGEVPVVFVVARAGADVDAERLRDAVVTRLSRIHRPEAVMVVDRLPENAVGKLDRKALTRRVADQVEESV